MEVTTQGLNGKPLEARGTYPAAIACCITNGKMPNIQFQQVKVDRTVPRVSHEGNSHFITGIGDGTQISYRYFDFEEDALLSVAVRGTAEGVLRVLSENGEAGRAAIHPCETWSEIPIPLTLRGVHPLLFRYEGAGQMELMTLRFDAR